ncbi:MAG: MFS transporter [Hyphomicrobiales bacterium]
MTLLAKVTLLFVVFVDLLGQGLVFPIINTLIMDPATGFLPKAAGEPERHFKYGLVIGMFFLSWFLGVTYISRVSDAIGRKNAILICLFGALIGYAITIASLYLNSIWLLILGRSITGFTAGNQPIAQAAMIDGSTDNADRARNMGYIITGVSFGLVGGPIIGAVLSDKSLLGNAATLELPFYGAFILVAIAIVLVLLFFTDIRTEREAFVFRPLEIIDLLRKVADKPLVMMLMPVYVVFMVANVTFYIFIDNYLTSAFGYGTLGGSMAMLTIGVALAFSSTFLVAPAQRRFTKQNLIAFCLIAWLVGGVIFVLSPIALICFIPIFFCYFMFGMGYPTILGLFSASVDDSEQGWVMGITTAVFTLAAGVMSLIGGSLMSIDIKLPFYIVIVSAALGLLAIALLWKKPAIAALVSTKVPEETGDELV